MSDIKQADGASAAITITLASLASDGNMLAGRESNAIDNSSNKYLDYLVAGKITSGTTPTVDTAIELWCIGTVDDSFTFPDVFAGADANRTPTSRDMLAACGVLVQTIHVTTGSNIEYWFRPASVASMFGGVLPKKFSFFVVHNSVAALHATGGNHVLTVSPRYATVA